MNESKASELLERIFKFLEENESPNYSHSLRSEYEKDGLEIFLKSNSLWGGAGSVADQAGIDGGREKRRKIEAILIDLGNFQIQEGILNQRTKMWTEVFTNWEKTNV
jgi:hypothetical protein